MRHAWMAVAILVCAGVGTACADCGQYEAGVSLGAPTDTRFREVSGLAASHTAPGLLWIHND